MLLDVMNTSRVYVGNFSSIVYLNLYHLYSSKHFTIETIVGIFIQSLLGMNSCLAKLCRANERRRYFVTASLIGYRHSFARQLLRPRRIWIKNFFDEMIYLSTLGNCCMWYHMLDLFILSWRRNKDYSTLIQCDMEGVLVSPVKVTWI